jgi:hypothetical protein
VNTLDHTSSAGRHTAGGIAALYLALAYLLAIPFFLLVVDYQSVTEPARRVALLASHRWSMHGVYLVTYVIFGIALSIVALALYNRLKTAAPALMQVATVVGLLWAFVLVASGMVFNAGMAAAVALYPTDPSGAASLWRAVEPVADGLGGSGGEILGGLWVLLVSFAGLSMRGLPKPLSWLGVAVGVVGLLSVIPALNDAAIAFGLLQIVWFMWLGIVMLRTTEHSTQSLALEVEPA